MADDTLQRMAERAGIETSSPAYSSKAEIDQPEFDQDSAGRYVATWRNDGIRMVLESPERRKLEFWVLLSVLWRPDPDKKPRSLITKKRLNLRSVSGTAEVVRYLKGQVDRDWAGRVEVVSGLTDMHYQAGEPMVWLHDLPYPGPVSYLADPLLELEEHNILFADGGSTKSFLALAMCLSYYAGKSLIPGVSVNGQGRSLYLDWETSKNAQRRRFAQFVGNAEKTGGVAYKRMHTPLVDTADEITALVSEHKFGLVICDSASMASGGEIMDEVAVAAFFLACRRFGTTVCTLAHVPKHGDHDRPIGSTYWYNQARVVWELVKDQTEGDSLARLDLIQHKGNNDKQHRPFGLELDFSAAQIVYRWAAAGTADSARLPVATQIERLLTNEGRLTVAEIAKKLGKTDDHIGNVLRLQTGKMFTHDGAKRDRLWAAQARDEIRPNVVGNTVGTTQTNTLSPLRGEGVVGSVEGEDPPWETPA